MKNLPRNLMASLFLIASIFLNLSSLSARSWDDLDEGEHRIFGSEKEQKYSINAFFMERENWENHSTFMFFWLFKYTDYPKYTSWRVIPFWYHLDSKIDNRRRVIIPFLLTYHQRDADERMTLCPLFAAGSDRYAGTVDILNFSWLHFYQYQWNEANNSASTTFFAPILPFTWHHTDKNGGHRNYLWLLDYSWRNTAGSSLINRFWLAPFFFWKGGASGYTHVLPPVFMSFRGSQGGRYSHLLPFYIGWRDSYTLPGIDGRPDIASTWRGIITPLFYSYKGSSSENSASEHLWWVPLLPLTWHYTSKDGGYRNILWLLDYSWNNTGEGSRLARFWLMPMFFWKGGETGYTHVLPPLFMSTRESGGNSYSHLLPFYCTWTDVTRRYTAPGGTIDDRITRGMVTPFFVSHTEKQVVDGATRSRRMWFPILPLYYYSNHEGLTHHNILGLIDIGGGKGKSRFWLPPLVLVKTGSYLHVLPPVYLSWRTENDDGTPASRHTNMLLLFDWTTGPEGLARFTFFPLVFHQAGDGGYRYYLPFYCRPAGVTKDQGLTFGLFHYHRWSRKEERKWYLIHYSYNNPARKQESYHWFPLYFSCKSPGWGFDLFLPFYFNYEDGGRSMHVNILGLSKSVISGPNPNVSIGLGKNEIGWYVDTDLSWLYDAVSIASRITIAKSKEAHEVPAATVQEKKPVGVELSEWKTMSRETSTSFWGFKFLFGILAYERADTRRHFRLLPLSWLTWDNESKDQIRWIGNYLSYKRGDVDYLVFFPFYGRQHVGESYKKGYVLNLYWDEFDAKDNLHERTVLWPVLNWYRSPMRSGWRVFPLLWHKSLADDTMRSHHTFSPLFYHGGKEALDGSRARTLSLSPAHLYRRKKEGAHEKTIAIAPIVPVFLYSKTVSPIAPSTAMQTPGGRHMHTASYLFPLYIWTRNTVEVPAQGTIMSDFTLTGLPLLYASRHSSGNEWERTFFLMGVYHYSSRDRSKLSILGGLYGQERFTRDNALSVKFLYGLISGAGSDGHVQSTVFPLYSHYSSKYHRGFVFMLGLFGWRSNPGKRTEDFDALFGWLHTSLSYTTTAGSDKNGTFAIDMRQRTSWLLPLFFYRSEDSKNPRFIHRFSLFASLPWCVISDRGADSYYSAFWFPLIPIYFHSDESGAAHNNLFWLIDWKSDPKNGKARQFVLPLFFRWSSPGRAHGNLLGLIDWKQDESTGLSHFMAIPLFFRWRYGERVHGNLLGIIDWLRDPGQDRSRFFFLPLVYTSHNPDSSLLYVFPLWKSATPATGESSFHLMPLYFSWRKPDTSSQFIAGLYLHSSPGYSRQNFLYLFDHWKRSGPDREKYGFLLDMFSHEISPEIRQFRLCYGMLMRFDSNPTSRDFDFDMLWFVFNVDSHGNNLRHWFFPLWYYGSNDSGYRLLVPPLLTYVNNRGEEGKFQMILAGALWYRNLKPEESYDRQMLLMGIPYYRVQKKERGYSSVGSLWGILWEYERESETNFSKISILKFIYKKVDMNGQVYHQVMGVRF